MENNDGLKILVVDDEENTRDACQRILARMNYQVKTASSGNEALKQMEAEQFAILLLDLKMPGIDGMEIMKQLRNLDDSVLVIVISGYATLETAIEAMKLGAYDFLAKPFEPDALRIVVKRATEKIRLAQEARRLEIAQQQTLLDLGVEKHRTRTILKSLPIGVMVTNEKGRAVLMNPSFLQLMNIDKETLPGEDIDTYVEDRGFCTFVKELSKGVSGEKNDTPLYELNVADERTLAARGRTISSDEGESLGAVITISDITFFKTLDQVKTEFVAEVSHELRSPLSTIHEQLALVIDDINHGKVSEDLPILTRALEKTRELISLVGDLLDLSRIESGIHYSEPDVVCVDELLTKIVDFLHPRAEKKGQTLSLVRDNNDPVEIKSDPFALESIFGNLISNAINYTPEEGSITVTVKNGTNRMEVTVSDTGMGIEEKYHDLIFKKFYRVRNEKMKNTIGTGLGLPIVKGLVDMLEGTISLESEPGKGSAFTVALPKNQAG